MIRRCFLLSLAGVPLRAAAEASAWKDYVNGRFGFKLRVPAQLQAAPEPANGQGCEFFSVDGEFRLAAYAHFLMDDDSLEKRWEEELAELGSTVSYQKKAKTWYVVSGVIDGEEFYRQTHVKGRNWVVFRISYPHVKAEKYDPWVEKIAQSFVPFLDGDYDRIVE